MVQVTLKSYRAFFATALMALLVSACGSAGKGSPEPLPTSDFDGGLVTNGDFAAGVEPWIGGAANVMDNGATVEYNFANVLAAGNAWDVNLSQVVPIDQGKMYTLTFDAMSDGSRTLVAGIGLNESPWTNASETITLEDKWATYTLTLSAADFGGENSRVIFDMGADTGVVMLDNVSLVEAGDVAPEPEPEPAALKLTVTAADATSVRMTGALWGWDPAAGPEAVDNGDDTWTVTMETSPTENMEYLWVVDGVQENMLNNDPVDLSCTPVTDSATHANRLWIVGGGDVTGEYFDSCSAPVVEETSLKLTLTVEGASAVSLTSGLWGWDPAGAAVAADNGDGTWTVTMNPAPEADMEYLWIVDGVQENIVDNDPADFSCTPVTDYWSYANRKWAVGGDDVTDYYDSCSAPVAEETGLKLTLTAEGASAVSLTSGLWGWDPAGAAVAADNGDGTWTVTMNPAPEADMEYLWIVDGVQENIVDNDPADFSCTPVTDYWSYANRKWAVGGDDVTDYYDSCSAPVAEETGLKLTLTVEGASAVSLTSGLWGWDPAGAAVAADNGDGTWTVTMNPAPEADMEYLWIVDGVQENIVDNDPADFSCTPVTDYWSYANRKWAVGGDDVTDYYDSCAAPTTGAAAELVVNGDFSSGADSWTGNAANVNPADAPGEHNFANVASAGNAWDVNLTQVLTIEQGKTYTLTFKAMSDRSRTLIAGIGLNEGPWTSAVETVTLGEEWATYTLTLSAADFGGDNSRVMFDMGAAAGVVIIDDVSLVEASASSI